MSTPINADDRTPLEALQSALCEILSAESSLNMQPEPLPSQGVRNHGYLSEMDANAAHAIEHLHAAFALVSKAQQGQEALKRQVSRLVEQLLYHDLKPVVKTWLDDDHEARMAQVEAEKRKQDLIDLVNNGFPDGGC